MPRFDLDPEQQAALEDAAAEVRRAEQALADAKRARNELVVRVLADVGPTHGTLAAVSRSAGVTLERVRQLRRDAEG